MTLGATKYSEEDLRRIYEEVKEASFRDTFERTELIFQDVSGGFGYSSPFVLNMFINIDEINKFEWPEDAVRGLFAHELGHMVSYKRRSFLRRMLFVWNYVFSISGRARVEREADRIAIERGYGKELIQERIHQFRIPYERRLETEKKAYASPEELKRMMASSEKEG